MSDALSCAELDGQQVELLPARTVLSMFSRGADGGSGADGYPGIGAVAIRTLGLDFPPGGGSNGVGAPGGNADGGAA